MSTLSENIKRYRKLAGLTQKDLAKKLGVTQQTIANYESAVSVPSWERLERLAKVLGVERVFFYADEIPITSFLAEKKVSGLMREIDLLGIQIDFALQEGLDYILINRDDDVFKISIADLEDALSQSRMFFDFIISQKKQPIQPKKKPKE